MYQNLNTFSIWNIMYKIWLCPEDNKHLFIIFFTDKKDP